MKFELWNISEMSSKHLKWLKFLVFELIKCMQVVQHETTWNLDVESTEGFQAHSSLFQERWHIVLDDSKALKTFWEFRKYFDKYF